jgi:site-specific recombinase XerD
MAYAFFFPSDQPLGDFAAIAYQGTSQLHLQMEESNISSGPHPHSAHCRLSWHRVLFRDAYLERLPGVLREKQLPSGEKIQKCIYSPHSLRATKATLLLMPRGPFESAQDLLDHKHITITQIYDKRRRSVRDSASHKVPI